MNIKGVKNNMEFLFYNTNLSYLELFVYTIVALAFNNFMKYLYKKLKGE